MKIEKANIHSYDVEELACTITGLNYDEIDADTETIDNKLDEEFGIDVEVFRDIISRLIPLIDVGKSPITNVLYKGFADSGKGVWLTKVKV